MLLRWKTLPSIFKDWIDLVQNSVGRTERVRINSRLAGPLTSFIISALPKHFSSTIWQMQRASLHGDWVHWPQREVEASQEAGSAECDFSLSWCKFAIPFWFEWNGLCFVSVVSKQNSCEVAVGCDVHIYDLLNTIQMGADLVERRMNSPGFCKTNPSAGVVANSLRSWWPWTQLRTVQ